MSNEPLLASLETGGFAMPCLGTDFNDLRDDPEGDIWADTRPWKLVVGQRVVVRDADGLKCEAVVCGPWFGAGRYVYVNLDGDFDYSECR